MKRDTLKIIASIERRAINEIVSQLIDECIERHKETIALLYRPEWVEMIKRGEEEVAKGAEGKSLDELAD